MSLTQVRTRKKEAEQAIMQILHELCRAVHAEQNMIVQAALYGVSLYQATVYCTTTPCIICAKMLVNCKIAAFMHPATETYPDESGMSMLYDANIAVYPVETASVKKEE